MITNSGIGDVETFLYYIENPGTNRLYELSIGAIVMKNGSQQPIYFGKAVLEGTTHNRWEKLNALTRSDALVELTQMVDNDFNKK